MSDKTEALRRTYDTTSSQVGKKWYLDGNGVEQRLAEAYRTWANANNQEEGAAFYMIPKKKYR